ncbi:hypothetical protein OSTOST_19728, partial [Ostertagia ostertagi]
MAPGQRLSIGLLSLYFTTNRRGEKEEMLALLLLTGLHSVSDRRQPSGRGWRRRGGGGEFGVACSVQTPRALGGNTGAETQSWQAAASQPPSLPPLNERVRSCDASRRLLNPSTPPDINNDAVCILHTTNDDLPRLVMADEGADEVKVFRRTDAEDLETNAQSSHQLAEDKKDVVLETELESRPNGDPLI